MFSRAFTQASRMSSRVIKSSAVKNVVKRHSHDHAGAPQPPYVQRTAPTKSVYFNICFYLTYSYLNMLN